MAKSPSHQFGQIIGGLLESAIEPLLLQFAIDNGLYLDKKGPRKARSGLACSWTDAFGNKHDLDYVLERGGSDATFGIPVAFIECAWRRYTKHSRNKVQEIEGALAPLQSRYAYVSPFLGVMVAGDFSEPALKQLRSKGFRVIHFPYECIVPAFARVGINAHWEENTPDTDFAQRVESWHKLGADERYSVGRTIIGSKKAELDSFMQALASVVGRMVDTVTIVPLHGRISELCSLKEAIQFIVHYAPPEDEIPLIRYEIAIRFSNGDRVEAHFHDSANAIAFLESYQAFPFAPVS